MAYDIGKDRTKEMVGAQKDYMKDYGQSVMSSGSPSPFIQGGSVGQNPWKNQLKQQQAAQIGQHQGMLHRQNLGFMGQRVESMEMKDQFRRDLQQYDILSRKREIERRVELYDAQQAAQRRRSRAGFLGTVGAIGGGIAGALVGGPGGAMIGAGIGQAAGSAIGGQQ